MEKTINQIGDIAAQDLAAMPPGVGLLIITLALVIVYQGWMLFHKDKELRKLRDLEHENSTETIKATLSLQAAFEGMKTEFLRLQQVINSRGS